MKKTISPKKIAKLQGNLEKMTDHEKRLADLLHYKKTGKRLIKARKIVKKREQDYEGMVLKRDIKNPYKGPKKVDPPMSDAVIYATQTFNDPLINS